MVLIKTRINKIQLPTLKKEDTYDKIRREARELREKKAEEKQQKEIEQIAEEKRMDKLIIKYLDDLQDQLEKKELLGFWIFQGEKGFIKHKNLTTNMMQKLIYKDIDKFKNKTVTNISIGFYHNDKPTDMHKSSGIYMTTGIEVVPVDKNGEMRGSARAWGCHMAWKMDDFKTTKFSFKLIETIYRQVQAKVILRPSLLGYAITPIIRDLEKLGLDFGKTLAPLPGA